MVLKIVPVPSSVVVSDVVREELVQGEISSAKSTEKNGILSIRDDLCRPF